VNVISSRNSSETFKRLISKDESLFNNTVSSTKVGFISINQRGHSDFFVCPKLLSLRHSQALFIVRLEMKLVSL
jgi:hypothetical protein